MDAENQSLTNPESVTPATVVSNPPSEPVQNNEKPAGWDMVEIPAEIKPRFDRIYGNMKRYENETKELRDINQRLLSTVNQLEQNQSKIVDHIQGKDFETAESQLMQQRKEALAKGDLDTFEALSDKITDIKLEKKLAKNAPRPVQQQLQQQINVSQEAMVETLVNKGVFTQDDAQIYRSWVGEADESGMAKRDWLNPKHPLNIAAAREGQAVFTNPAFINKPVADKLNEIDRRMGLMQPNTSQQNVLPSGNLTRGTPKSKVQLSPYQEKVAVMTKFGGSKAKTEADHIEAYRQAVIKSQSKGAKR